MPESVPGCIACVMAFEFKYDWALTFIIISAVFDFLDGMSARVLHAPSPIGKELDSLADDISFGLVPSVSYSPYCVRRLTPIG